MVVIPSPLIVSLVAAARAAGGVEVCGLLLGRGNAVEEARPTQNVSPTPDRAFEIAPEALFAALREARRGGPAILGHYHSHPGGEPVPSSCDALAATGDGSVWLILGATRGGMWRAVRGGSVHGRFDPVAWRRAAGDGLHDMPALFSYGTFGDSVGGA